MSQLHHFCFLWTAPCDTAQLSSWLLSISVVSSQVCVLPIQSPGQPGHHSMLSDKRPCGTLVARKGEARSDDAHGFPAGSGHTGWFCF